MKAERFNFLVKMIAGTIVLSFVIGGLVGSLGSRNDCLVKVLGRCIKQEEYMHEMHRRGLNTASREQKVNLLMFMVSNISFENFAKRMHLVFSDDVVLDILKKDKNFQNKDGKFSPKKMEEFFARNGISLEDYKGFIVQDTMSKIVNFGFLNSENEINKEFIRHSFEFENLKYDLLINEIDKKSVKVDLKITDVDRSRIYKEFERFFIKDEKRVVKYVNASSLVKSKAVSKQEILDFYNEAKDRFTVISFFRKVCDSENAALEIQKTGKFSDDEFFSEVNYASLPNDERVVFDKAHKDGKATFEKINDKFVVYKVEKKKLLPLDSTLEKSIGEYIKEEKHCGAVDDARMQIEELVENGKLKDGSYAWKGIEFIKNGSVSDEYSKLKKETLTMNEGEYRVIQTGSCDFILAKVEKIELEKKLELEEVKSQVDDIWNNRKVEEMLNKTHDELIKRGAKKVVLKKENLKNDFEKMLYSKIAKLGEGERIEPFYYNGKIVIGNLEKISSNSNKVSEEFKKEIVSRENRKLMTTYHFGIMNNGNAIKINWELLNKLLV